MIGRANLQRSTISSSLSNGLAQIRPELTYWNSFRGQFEINSTDTSIKCNALTISLSPVNLDIVLLEILSVVFIQQDKIDKMTDLHSVVNVPVGGRQFHSRKVQSDGHYLSLDGATVHDLELLKRLQLVLHDIPRPEYLFAHDAQLHRFDAKLYEVERDLPDDAVLQMVMSL